MEVKSGGCSVYKKGSVPLLAFSLLFSAGIQVFCQEKEPDLELQKLKWEKDFELILEINGIPTRGQMKLEKDLAQLEIEKETLLDRKEKFEDRLRVLNTTFSSERLYDEMLEEDTHDLNATKDSISRKLAVVNDRLNEIDDELRKLNLENRR